MFHNTASAEVDLFLSAPPINELWEHQNYNFGTKKAAQMRPFRQLVLNTIPKYGPGSYLESQLVSTKPYSRLYYSLSFLLSCIKTTK